MKKVWTARQKEITYGTKIAIFNKTGRNSGRNMVCRIQRALNFVPAAQSLQTVKGMGIGMNTVKPFYESRKKVYDCHVWWHPNFPFHLHKHMEFVHVTEGEMDATVAGVNYHLITGDCLMIYFIFFCFFVCYILIRFSNIIFISYSIRSRRKIEFLYG